MNSNIPEPDQELVRSNSSGNNSDFEDCDDNEGAVAGDEDDGSGAYVVGQLRNIKQQQ